MSEVASRSKPPFDVLPRGVVRAEVSCPRCGAKVGRSCHRVNGHGLPMPQRPAR